MSETTINQTEKKSRLVFKADIARQLLKSNMKIIDIKPDKSNHDRTIFVFDNTPEFQEKFDEIINDLQDRKLHDRRKEKRESKKKED